MEEQLIPHLFRTEYQKMVAVLLKRFGLQQLEQAEDIVSETFLSATENWSQGKLPDNPTAWLYTVAKNKTKNSLKRNSLFDEKIIPKLSHEDRYNELSDLDLSPENITDSQLAMMFTVCHPAIPSESQTALALSLLCGFGAQEISDAFLTNKEVIYKRINRAKEKLKAANISIQQPHLDEIKNRLEPVLTTIYLLFSEGYYSSSHHTTLRKDLCLEAMRLTHLLLQNAATNTPATNALMALICFHSSRFDARTNDDGLMILYQEQNPKLWNQELMERGNYFLNQAATGQLLTKYHLEAGIAYWHTQVGTPEKWVNILDLYDHLLTLQYSSVAALNRLYALSQVHGNEQAIKETEQLALTDNHFYHLLLGKLYHTVNPQKSFEHFEQALDLAKTASERQIIRKHLSES